MALDPTADAPPATELSFGIPAMLLAVISAGLPTGGELAPLLEHYLEPVIRLAGAQADTCLVRRASSVCR